MRDPALTALLRSCARVSASDDDLRQVSACARHIRDWTPLPALAEAHGIAPLVHAHLTAAGVVLPLDVHQRLFGTVALHRAVGVIRFRELASILDACESAGIRVIVLKGGALAHLLYPSPALRPLSDLDLLVDPADAARAQAILGRLGFDAPATPPSRRLMSHHHLPAASKRVNGHNIQVEIHVDALSLDTGQTLPLAPAYDAGQSFLVEGRQARAFGDLEMLTHLSRHVSERAALLRLVWVADLIGYAARFHDRIDWDAVRTRSPFVLNVLSLLHLVTPLPRVLTARVRPSARHDMPGIGETCRPLAEAIRGGRAWRAIARDVLAPPEWWMRLYYGLDDRAPMLRHRALRHPLHVGRWMARRAGAYTRFWVRHGAR